MYIHGIQIPSYLFLLLLVYQTLGFIPAYLLTFLFFFFFFFNLEIVRFLVHLLSQKCLGLTYN